MKELITIQQKLKAPKDNKADKYKFRSAEDILEKVKPYLVETETAVICSDEVQEIGGRLFLKATASLLNGEYNVIAQASAFAEFDSHIMIDKYSKEQKKSMSNEQASGCASSYARKYALCGLFAIDNDENDPDQPTIAPKPAEQPETKAPLPADKAPDKLSDIKTAVQMKEMQMKLDAAFQSGRIAQAVYDQKNAQLRAHGNAIGCTLTDGEGWVDNADLFGE